MDFYTKYKRPAPKFVEIVDRDIVERGTYVSSDKLIKSFINAGKVVSGARQVQYDFPNGEDDGRAPDPTRRPDFDLADFSHIVNTLRNKDKLEEKGAKNEVNAATDSSSSSLTESTVNVEESTSELNSTD